MYMSSKHNYLNRPHSIFMCGAISLFALVTNKKTNLMVLEFVALDQFWNSEKNSITYKQKKKN